MALVNHHKIKLFDRHFGGVFHRNGLLVLQPLLQPRRFVRVVRFSRFVQLFAFQNRIEPLNGGNAHLAIVGNITRREPLHVVEFGELAVVVVRTEVHKLLLGLFAQIARIYKKQNPFGFGEFQQTINERNGSESLARTRRHLNQRPRAVVAERFFEIRHRLNLCWSKSCCVKCREVLQTASKAFVIAHPLGKSLWSMKRKNHTAAGFGVAVVGEMRQRARCLIHIDKRFVVQVFQFCVGVAHGLFLHNSEIYPFLLSFSLNDTNRLPVDKQDVISRSLVSLVLTYSYTKARRKIYFIFRLDFPPCLFEQRVDLITCYLFRILIHLRSVFKGSDHLNCHVKQVTHANIQ